MTRAGRPWAVVITAVTCALVAAGALAAAAAWKNHEDTSADTGPSTPPVTTSGVGVDGCAVEPCEVLSTISIGGTNVELVADNGYRSGRLRIGGAGSSDVIEVTITERGATLGKDSLQCVSGTLAACLIRGQAPQGVVGQVVVGRSTKWNQLSLPFESDAGYLALADVLPDTGAEVLVAQHRCDRTTTPDCSATPVYVRVYNLRSEDRGCTRNYSKLENLPDWPQVSFRSTDVRQPCP
jgi:hypothetical protein